MNNLSDRERKAKLEAIRESLKGFIYIVKPFNTVYDIWERAAIAYVDEGAERLMQDLEQVEIDFLDRRFQAKEQSRD